MVASLPPSVVGGAKAKAKVSVVVTNPLVSPLNGPVTVRLFVSADETLDGADTPAGTASKKLRLRLGAGKAIKVKVASFPAVPDGVYHLLAQIQAPDGTTTVAAAPNTFQIAAPFVDLRASAPVAPATLRAARRATAVVPLDNLGNVPARGTASVMLYASSDATLDAATDRLLGTFPLKLSLKPGASKRFKLKFLPPADLVASGGVYLIASLTAGSAGDHNAANDTAVSAAPSVVV